VRVGDWMQLDHQIPSWIRRSGLQLGNIENRKIRGTSICAFPKALLKTGGFVAPSQRIWRLISGTHHTEPDAFATGRSALVTLLAATQYQHSLLLIFPIEPVILAPRSTCQKPLDRTLTRRAVHFLQARRAIARRRREWYTTLVSGTRELDRTRPHVVISRGGRV
jgi:hypothetical protein